MNRKCPFCSSVMHVETVEGVVLDVCPSCGATWFDAKELMALFSRGPEAVDKLESLTVPPTEPSKLGASDLKCPDCQVPLDEYRYMYNTPVKLHSCPVCSGLLVAEGDVARMEQFRNEAHEETPASVEAARLLAEATTEHEAEMERQGNVARFFKFLHLAQPGWLGFWP